LISSVVAAPNAATPTQNVREEIVSVILGQGEYTYRVAEGWGKLPPGWRFGDVAAVGVDRHDRVYAFNRGEHPMCVFDRDGNFIKSWG